MGKYNKESSAFAGLCVIILLFISNFSFSQNYIIADSETKSTLPFVAVHYNGDGFYAGEYGELKLPEALIGNIKLQYLGYHSTSLSLNDLSKIKDTVFMIPYVQNLSEIVITSKLEKREFIKPLRNSSRSWLLSPKHELLVLLHPKDKYVNALIEKIHLPFSSRHFLFEKHDKSYKDAYAFIRINIYQLENKLPGESIYSSQPIKINGFSKDEIIVNVADTFIELHPGGLFFGIELIGYFNNGENIESKEAFVRPAFTKRICKHFSAETFIKLNTFQGEDYFKSIKSLLGSSVPKGENNMNLAIGFTLIPQEN